MPQFDTENRYALYGTYADNLIAGSSSTNPERPWTRGVYGSIVSGSEEYTLATRLSDYEFQRAYSFFRNGNARFLRLTSATQVFQDSVMPSIVSLALTGTYGAGKLGIPGQAPGFSEELTSNGLLILFSTSDSYAVTASGGMRINNIEWQFSSPFEKKYSDVPLFNAWPYPVDFGPFQVQPPDTLTWKPTGGGLSQTKRYSLIVVKQPRPLFHYFFDSYIERTGSAGNFTQTSRAVTSDNDSLTKKVFFGVGVKQAVSSYVTYGQATYYTQCSGALIEGWKYGIYNGLPTKFSCVFRRDHFGHPRDLLEGRPYTKTFNDPVAGGPLDEAGGISFLSGSALSGESDNWLTASVYSSRDVVAAYRVNPYGSGIFDKAYRASMPWFDNDPRIT